jgi:hypothetical protein
MNLDTGQKRAAVQILAAVVGAGLWGLVLGAWRASERAGINVWLLGSVLYLASMGLAEILAAAMVLVFGRNVFSSRR